VSAYRDCDRRAADFQTHYIEGYAIAAREAGRDGHFKAPLVSHIEGNLYMGGCLDGTILPDDFHKVFSLYPWEKYTIGPKTERVELRLYDAAEMPDEATLHDVADQVVESLTHGKTLVHCQAGLNRSGLISALVLVKLGRSPADAIALLREKRHAVVLCNATFESWLLEQVAS